MKSHINLFNTLALEARDRDLHDYAVGMESVAAVIGYENPNITVLDHLTGLRTSLMLNLTFEWPSEQLKSAWQDAVEFLDVDISLLQRLEAQR